MTITGTDHGLSTRAADDATTGVATPNNRCLQGPGQAGAGTGGPRRHRRPRPPRSATAGA